MRVLLDTQLIVWWLKDARQLPRGLGEYLGDDNDTACVSRVSQWELAIKISCGKLRMDLPRFTGQVERDGFEWLEIRSPHVLASATLPRFDDHKDPFDRLLVAQSLTEPLILLTVDEKLGRYGELVRVL